MDLCGDKKDAGTTQCHSIHVDITLRCENIDTVVEMRSLHVLHAKKIYLKELDNMKIFHNSIILNWMSADKIKKEVKTTKIKLLT